MSLNYRIYWVDDSPDFAETVKEEISLHFEKDIINIIANIVEDGDNIEDIARSTALDLFVLDYGLDGRNGDELIQSLRANGEITEIVFYSQDEKIHEKCKNIEGVHLCERAHAGEKLKTVINRFIDRCGNVAVMRGMIISEAIDVENRLTSIILEMFGDKRNLFQEKILNKPILDFEKKRAFLQSVLNDQKKEEEQKASKDQVLIDKLNRLSSSLNEFKKEIVDQRNILAHSEKTFDGGMLTLKPLTKGPAIKFDNIWKNLIRDNIKKHMQNLHEINELLHK